MVKVTDVEEVSQAVCIVNIDSYVPISFRSRTRPIAGARYIRLGDFNTQLFELQFPPESLTLNGFTLVSGEAAPEARLTGNGSSVLGLPIFSLSLGEAFDRVATIPRLDIQTNVALSCRDRQADVSLGGAKTFDRRIVYGRVQFLISDDVLVGLRVLDLTESEQQILRDYIAQRSNRRQ
jgi:hypothetical protein